jgi:hypothetical protein
MQSYEWIESSGKIYKTDAAGHGDDHFFPGPTDIAWDLAGIAVEWDLSTDAVHYLLDCFRRSTGDDASPRLPCFELTYAVFRAAWCRMALPTVIGSSEQPRLHADYARYRRRCRQLLNKRRGRRPLPCKLTLSHD